MSKKPIVDKEACIGAASCEAVCPEVFRVNDEGKAEVLAADYEALKDKIDDAIAACPVDAIHWKDGKPEVKE